VIEAKKPARQRQRARSGRCKARSVWRQTSLWARTCLSAICLAGAAAAQVAPGVQPGVIEKEFQAPQKPLSDRVPVPGPQSPMAPADAEKIRFVLKSVAFSGNTALTSEELAAVAVPFMGQEISLGQAFAMANEVTRLYAERGYALSVGFLPAQEIDGGALKIEVVEGYVEDVVIDGDIADRQDLWLAMGQSLRASKPLRTADLERALLLVDDLPGVAVSSVFEKSEAGRGATTLNVIVTRDPFEGSLSLNNRGSAALGPIRAELALAANNLLGLEERLSVQLVRTPVNDELGYVAGSFAVPLDADGTILFADASYSRSNPGTFFLSLLEYAGDGFTGTLGVRHPFIRSRAENLVGGLSFTFKDLTTDTLGFPFSKDRLSIIDLTLDYDIRDDWGGVNQVLLRLSAGLDVLDATKSDDPLRSRFAASGEFFVGQATLARLQTLSDDLSLYLEVSGQYADRPLLTSEMCGYGGGQAGRAFDSFEISGDHCIKAVAELRWVLPPLADGYAFQLYAFADAGYVRRKGPIGFDETRTAEGQSAGGGIRMWAGEGWSGGLEVAVPFSRGVALESASKDPRVFGYLTFSF